MTTEQKKSPYFPCLAVWISPLAPHNFESFFALPAKEYLTCFSCAQIFLVSVSKHLELKWFGFQGEPRR